jgi:hypothetical protein
VPHLLLLFSSPAQNGLDATHQKEHKVFFMWEGNTAWSCSCVECSLFKNKIKNTCTRVLKFSIPGGGWHVHEGWLILRVKILWCHIICFIRCQRNVQLMWWNFFSKETK